MEGQPVFQIYGLLVGLSRIICHITQELSTELSNVYTNIIPKISKGQCPF